MVQVLDPLHSGSASGSYADVTHQRSRGRHIIKARAGPKINTSDKRTSHRAMVAYAAGTWSSLTHAQREDWRAYAATINRVDPFGRARQPSGYHAYMSQAIYRLRMSAMPLTSPPWTVDPPAPHTSAQVIEICPGNWGVVWSWAAPPHPFDGYTELWVARTDTPGETPHLTAASFYRRQDWDATGDALLHTDPGTYHAWTRSVGLYSGRASHFVRAEGTRTIT